MNRPEYWKAVLITLAIIFALSYVVPADTISVLEFLGMVAFWIFGAARMDDTKHSQAWAIFAPFLIGTIVIGCLPSKPKEGAS